MSGAWVDDPLTGLTTNNPGGLPQTGDNDSGPVWNPNASPWTQLVSAALPVPTGGSTDWNTWGRSHPGFYGQYTDPATGQQLNIPPPDQLVGGGYSQAYNPQSGQWEITGTPNGGFFGFVENNPYLFAALAATAAIGGPVLAGAAPAVGAGEGATLAGEAGTDVLAGAAPEGLAAAEGASVADAGLTPLSLGSAGLTAPTVGSPGLLSSLSALAPYAPLVSAGVSGIGAIIGANTSANAARDAATTQANAATAANATLSRIYDQSRADLAPYRAVGTAALGQLAGLTDQPLTYGAFDEKPYAFTPPTGQQVLNDDPGYQFRVEQGQKALERSGASRGLTLSGGQLKDLTRFGQGQAAQEYQAAYERSRQRNQMGYERGLGAYNTNFGTLTTLRNTRYNELAGLAGTGQTATNAANTLAANTGTQLAANTTSAGAAQAAGQVGAASAVNTGISGVGSALNSFNQYNLLSQQLANQNQQYALLSSLAQRKAA
jgi:hypothetical protein